MEKKNRSHSLLTFAIAAGTVYVGYHAYQFLKERMNRPKYIEVPYPIEEQDEQQEQQEYQKVSHR